MFRVIPQHTRFTMLSVMIILAALAAFVAVDANHNDS